MHYDANEVPACPAVRVIITDNNSGTTFGPFDALIDTGADTTCIPNVIVDRIPGLIYSWYDVDFGDGSSKRNRFVSIDDATVEFLDSRGNVLLRKAHTDLLLQTIQSGYLGRDILNEHVCEFDGPKKICMIR